MWISTLTNMLKAQIGQANLESFKGISVLNLQNNKFWGPNFAQKLMVGTIIDRSAAYNAMQP